jgi:hypothetical protein
MKYPLTNSNIPSAQQNAKKSCHIVGRTIKYSQNIESPITFWVTVDSTNPFSDKYVKKGFLKSPQFCANILNIPSAQQNAKKSCHIVGRTIKYSQTIESPITFWVTVNSTNPFSEKYVKKVSLKSPQFCANINSWHLNPL